MRFGPFVFTAALAAFVLATPAARADDTKPPDRSAERGFVGFSPKPAAALSADEKSKWNLPPEAGAVVVSVLPDGPAAKAGIREGDEIVEYAGQPVPATTDVDPNKLASVKEWEAAFSKIAMTVKVGASVKIVVKRDGKAVTLEAVAIDGATIEALSRSEKDGGKEAPEPGKAPTTDHGYLGFSPRPAAALSPKLRENLKIRAETGVVAIRVTKGSPAEKAGLVVGDVIVRYAGQDVPSTDGIDRSNVEGRERFAAAVRKISMTVKPGAEVEIVVLRDGKPVTLKATAVDLATMEKLSKDAGQDPADDEDDGEEAPERPGPDDRLK